MRGLIPILLVVVFASAATIGVWADPSAPAPGVATKSAPRPLTYKGRVFAEWSVELQTELCPERKIEILKALIAFGRQGNSPEAISSILSFFDGYRPEFVWEVLGREPNYQYGDWNSYLAEEFLDPDDVKAFHTAGLGLRLLANHATPQLVTFLETPSEHTTARLAVLVTLMRRDDPALGTLSPKLAARSDQFAERFWDLWGDKYLRSMIDTEVYETAAQKMLEFKDQPQLLRAIESMGANEYGRYIRRHGNGDAVLKKGDEMLKKLEQSTTDPAIREAIESTLEARKITTQ
ncbi:MAG: hypothetical protein JWN70_2175 [Planctomycetaceae bacterium]|nr:hypothetical protein [Planctomycetaceae bacterium]